MDSRVQMYVWKVVRVVLCLNVHTLYMYIHAKCVYVGIHVYTCIVKVCARVHVLFVPLLRGLGTFLGVVNLFFDAYNYVCDNYY